MSQMVAVARTEGPLVFVGPCLPFRHSSACWSALEWTAGSKHAALHVALPAASSLVA
jgi:hypothetical protein